MNSARRSHCFCFVKLLFLPPMTALRMLWSIRRIAGLFLFRGKAQDVTSPAHGGNIDKNDSTTSEINARNTRRYSGFQIEKDWTAISFNRDGNGSEAYRDKFGSLGVPKRFVFRGISVDSYFKAAKEQADTSTVLPDAEEQAKISGRGMKLRRRIDFHPTLIAESGTIVGPPILKHHTEDRLLGDGPDAITILLAAHETGEIFYAEPILKWMVTIYEEDGAERQCSVSARSYESEPVGQVHIHLSPRDFCNIFDVISAAGSATGFILTLSLHFSAYCGLFETILLSIGTSEDFAAHGVRIPAELSSIALRPL